MKKLVTIELGKKSFPLSPNIDLILEMEEEFGSLIAFINRLQNNKWKMSEMMIFLHMALAHNGFNIDFKEMSNQAIETGMVNIIPELSKLLGLVLTGRLEYAPLHVVRSETRH